MGNKLNFIIVFSLEISMILVIIFFWSIDTKKAPGIQDVMGVLYMASAETIFSTAYTPLYEIEREIPIFRREAAMYCPSAYYVATLVSWVIFFSYANLDRWIAERSPSK